MHVPDFTVPVLTLSFDTHFPFGNVIKTEGKKDGKWGDLHTITYGHEEITYV